MDLTKAAVLRELLTGTELAGRTTSFAHSLRRFTTRTGGLLLFGPPDDEPWHLTAHIDDELHNAGVEDVRPSLVRWSPPPGAPPHLAIGLDRLRDSGRGESLLVVSEQTPADALLERIHDVRRRGTTIFSIDNGNKDLADLSHESLVPELLIPATFGTGWVAHPVGDPAEDPAKRDASDAPPYGRPGDGRDRFATDPAYGGAGDARDRFATDPAYGGSGDARDRFALDHDEPDHGRHAVPEETLTALRDAVAGFEMTQHLVSLAVADDDITASAWRRRLRTFIERLGGEPA